MAVDGDCHVANEMLGAYQDGEVTAARVAACKMGFLETTGDTKYEGEDDGTATR